MGFRTNRNENAIRSWYCKHLPVTQSRVSPCVSVFLNRFVFTCRTSLGSYTLRRPARWASRRRTSSRRSIGTRDELSHCLIAACCGVIFRARLGYIRGGVSCGRRLLRVAYGIWCMLACVRRRGVPRGRPRSRCICGFRCAWSTAAVWRRIVFCFCFTVFCVGFNLFSTSCCVSCCARLMYPVQPSEPIASHAQHGTPVVSRVLHTLDMSRSTKVDSVPL